MQAQGDDIRRGRILAAEGDQDYAVDKARVRLELVREVVESNEVEVSSIGIWLARELQRLVCRSSSLIRRSLPALQLCLMAQLWQALVQWRRRTNPFSSVVKE